MADALSALDAGFAIFSYNGRVTFGLNADHDSVPDLPDHDSVPDLPDHDSVPDLPDHDSVPDLPVLARGIERGLEELRALLPHHPKQKDERYPCQYA